MVDNFECAGYTFYSKFDSGNLGRVELVRCCEGLNIIGSNVSSSVASGNLSLSTPSCIVPGGSLSPGAATTNLQQGPPPPPPTSGLMLGTATVTGGGNSPSAVLLSSVATAAQQQQLLSPQSAAPVVGSVTTTAAGGGVSPDLHHQLLSHQPHHHSTTFVEVEFNLWTRPDCAGTPYENQNRTWFYFAVTGGRPNQIVKFNVMNLNKQAKLFSQGMHPVMKVGPGGRWERIKDKPSYSIANDVFFISFLHRAPESSDTKTYYAFTFPFTYNELLEQLGNFDKRFARHPYEMNQIAYEITQRYDSSVPVGPVEIALPVSHHSQGHHSSKKGKLVKVAKVERSSPESFDDTARDGIGNDEAIVPKVSDPGGRLLDECDVPSAMSIDDNNTSESMQQITNLVNKVKIELPPQVDLGKCKLPIFQQLLSTPTLEDDARATNLDPRDDIYYYRELLTHSVEKRRVELLTITSFHGIQTTREERLRNLFPDEKTPRCHTFKHKKVVFISSRVHPGETPASFVLNGFLSMLLDRKSIVSITLRRMYVFKIIPFLNPDGVYNGLYRSDTRGHNLNRVYLTPNVETQPAIYAARKLIRYYHLGMDEIEPYELENEKKAALLKSPDTSSEEVVNVSPLEDKPPSALTETTAPSKECPPIKKDSESNEDNNASTSDSGFGDQTVSKSSTISSSSSTVTLVGPEISTPSVPTATTTDCSAPVDPSTATNPTVDAIPSNEVSSIATTDEVLPPPKVFTEQLIPDLLPVVTESGLALRPIRSASNLSTASSMANSTTTNASTIAHINTKKPPLVTAKVDTGRKAAGSSSSFKNVINKPHLIATTPNMLKMKDFGVSPSQQQSPQLQQQQQTQSSLGKMAPGSLGVKKANPLHHKRAEGKMRPQTPQMFSHFRSHRNEYLNPASQKNLNISLDYLAQLDEKNDKVIYEERSNMFLYIDLHGHASKKGVFMYGNHLPSTIEAVECMLLPRLMSMNSQHFHYDACNFSERNMYYKGKRDGLSKEGSGRVAIYKCTGLIKSYTLECNYNTGKSVNILPPRGKESATAKVQSPVPPKYTPAVFEEVGRALGPSILDLTNSNPQSRVHNSEFRTLQGLRNTLRIEIERGSSKARVTNKVPKPHSKRLSNQSSSSLEIAKENALQWENMGVPPSGSIAGAGGAGSPPGAGGAGGNGNGNGKGNGESLGANASGCCSATSSGGRQFLKGGTLKGHSGKISRKAGSAVGKGFGKKDVVKKSKILCESGVAGPVVASGKKLQELIRNKDQHQVPRKKIKVSPPHQHGSAVDGFDLCFKSNLAASSLPNFLAAPPTLGDLPLSKKVKSESKLLEECLDCDDSLDAIPCCSYTLPATTSGGAVALTKLISTYSQAAVVGSPGVASGEGVPPIILSGTTPGSCVDMSPGGGSSSGGEKDAGKAGKISKFSKATSAKQQSKLGKSSKSNDGGKLLKKKRSLKTDSNLKRKKTRVKPALT